MSVVNTIKERMNKLRVIAEENMASVKTENSVRENRLILCNSCEFLLAETGSCKKCGCFVKAKTWLAGTSCPIGKW